MMHSRSPILLLLEDSLGDAVEISQAVSGAFPDVQLLPVCSVEEARAVVAEKKVSLVLSEILLPDGNGLDFLEELAEARNPPGAIVITGSTLPEDIARAEKIGAIRYFQKPVDLQHLVEVLRVELSKPAEGFQALLSHITPMDIVQLKCMGGATGGIEFATGNKVGRIFFIQGDVVHAEIGPLAGVEAFNEIVTWKSGNAAELEDLYSDEPTITGNWQMLLLNAAKQLDERMRVPA